MKNTNKIIEFLKKTNHNEIICQINKLTTNQADHLLADISSFSNYPLTDFRHCLPSSPTPPFKNPKLLLPSKEAISLGKRALLNGEVQTIILAGGDGSRLKFDKPKALFPLPYKGGQKRLIDFLLEKIPLPQTPLLLVSKRGYPFLKEALKGQNVSFVIQNNLPFLTLDFEWLLKEDGHLLQGPSGNGGLLEVINLKALKAKGVRYIEIMPVDNPLISPCDPLLIGSHIETKSEITAKCFETKDLNEKVGRFAKKGDKTCIIDYTTHEEVEGLKFANINHMVFSLDFLERINQPLPIHWVKKEVLFQNQPITIYKGERFITDLIEYATPVSLVLTKKETSFCPVKSLEDINGLLNLIR